MVAQPRLTRRNAQFVQSQLAIELVFWLYILLSAVMFIRLALKLLAVPARVWTTQVVFGLTDVLIWPVMVLPGATRTMLGAATLADLTVVAILLLVPLTFALGGRRAD